MPSTSSLRKIPETVASASDLAALASLSASHGNEALRDLLQAYFAGIDDLCERLQAASRRDQWQSAVQTSGEIAAQAAQLGFRSVANSARSFVAAVQENLDAHTLRNGAQMIVFEHERLRLGIMVQFPELLV